MYRRKERRDYFIIAKAMLCLSIACVWGGLYAQRQISLEETVKLAVANSKSLRLAQNQIERITAQYDQIKDNALPKGSVSYVYNHIELLNSTFQLVGLPNAFNLNSRYDLFLGSASLSQVVFGGNKLKFAKESLDVLKKISKLDESKEKNEIILQAIHLYVNLYKIQKSLDIVRQNLSAVDRQIKQAQDFFEQGIVTKNEVLRFQLQKSNLELTRNDWEANKKIVSYSLSLLLGLSEDTDFLIEEIEPSYLLAEVDLNSLVDSALLYRRELKSLDLQSQAADIQIKSLQGELLPKFLLSANVYYINPTINFFPNKNEYLLPISVGAGINWEFDKLWTNKHKKTEAYVQKNQALINKGWTIDRIKSEVNRDYQNYQNAVKKIAMIQTAITQAEENDKILSSKYKNNTISVVERIDGDTQLYQALINMELAKADEALAYYSLLKSIGKINDIVE